MSIQVRVPTCVDVLQLERQIQMQNYMRERQMAMELARQREMFYNWYSPFYATLCTLCTLG